MAASAEPFLKLSYHPRPLLFLSNLFVGLQELGTAFAVVAEGAFKRGLAFAVGFVGDDDLCIQEKLQRVNIVFQ